MFQDDPTLLEVASKYLRFWEWGWELWDNAGRPANSGR